MNWAGRKKLGVVSGVVGAGDNFIGLGLLCHPVCQFRLADIGAGQEQECGGHANQNQPSLQVSEVVPAHPMLISPIHPTNPCVSDSLREPHLTLTIA